MAVRRSPTGVAALEVAAAMSMAVGLEHRAAGLVAVAQQAVSPVCCPVG